MANDPRGQISIQILSSWVTLNGQEAWKSTQLSNAGLADHFKLVQQNYHPLWSNVEGYHSAWTLDKIYLFLYEIAVAVTFSLIKREIWLNQATTTACKLHLNTTRFHVDSQSKPCQWNEKERFPQVHFSLSFRSSEMHIVLTSRAIIVAFSIPVSIPLTEGWGACYVSQSRHSLPRVHGVKTLKAPVCLVRDNIVAMTDQIDALEQNKYK